MKKARILFISAIVAVFACVLLVGCSKTEKISSIELKDINADDVIEVQIGKFDFESYTLIVSYDSGSTKEVTLTEDMVSELDRLKLYQAGEHVITVSYSGKTCEVNISVKRNVFGDLNFPENNVFTYDGKEHKVELMGELPANATISYIGGNSFVNAGTYDVTAVVSCNGYVTERVTTKVTIERAKYDMSKVKFESKEVVYNGKAHSIEITGELPEGVGTPTYYINGNKVSSAIDADKYTVTAVFTNTDPNYEAIPSMEATLNITPAEYTIKYVDLIFKNADGEELFIPWKTYDGLGVSFDIDNRASLTNHLTISYTIYDEVGDVISRSNTQTNIQNVGVYTIKVEFDLLDNKNYKPIDPMTFTFEICKARYDTSKFFFDSKVVEYDNEKHSIAVTLPSDFDASKVDISYEYSLGDKLIFDDGKLADGVFSAGAYSVKAVFTVKNENYEEISPMQATLLIEKKELPLSEFGFEAIGHAYTGEDIIPSLNFEAENYLSHGEISVYKLIDENYVKVDNIKDAGTYRAEVDLSILDTQNYVFDNGEASTTVIGDFVIEQAEIDISDIRFNENNTKIVNLSDAPDLNYSVWFEFDTKNIEGLTYRVAYYTVVGSDLEELLPLGPIQPEESGMIRMPFYPYGLLPGKYIFAIEVSTESENYVLGTGSETAEYYFEFEIAD